MSVVTDWVLLCDAYGSAELIEALLARADSNDAVVWDELWSRLCHQGTVYTASYVALPRLAELAARWNHPTLNTPFFLATSIIASTSGPERPDAVRARYAEPVRVLREVAGRLVQEASDDTDFLYKAETLLATESDSVWATQLHALAGDEWEFECPNCGEQLMISLEVSPATVAALDDGLTPCVVEAADPAHITDVETRVYLLALEGGRSDVASRLLELFGVFECPCCGHKTSISGAHAR
jgi:predicted RNA-binding Zn-ribbon protein involved in translation (DUF1610 family)